MSGISDTATVTLNVNGAQAKRMMADVQDKIDKTRASLDKLKQSGGDPRQIRKLQSELRSLNRQLSEMQSATQGVTNALENLDSATPRQLEKALRTLNRQLKDMTPGTKTWNSHIQQIQTLRARLSQLNEQVRGQESLWQRFTKWWFNSGTAVAAIITGYQTAMSTLRSYVDDFSRMEEAMADTRKFTGLAEDAVRGLNEEFKRMDTRSSREQLNALAQEAGRLGKDTREAVKGYVEAADVINVALDELGDGATQQIAKLTDIFGIEAEHGTRDAMLKTSSVVNDLSQSCTASAPYIVEFTKRLAGVGAQAKMTVPEIMSFAAVLDASGQNVEMSATAISQTVMKMFQKPAEIARTVGLDVKAFTDTLRKNTTEGLLMFLEKLNTMGGDKAISQLAPLFKDLGLDGARMSAVLAVCAGRVDLLRQKMVEANESFRLGTSTMNEFNIFNNTVQASIDKARKRLNDLSVELGERLYPLMRHMYSSGSAVVRLLLTTVKFVERNKKALAGAVLALAAYTLALKGVALATGAYHASLKLVAAAEKAWLTTLASLKAGVLLLQAGVYALTGHLDRARVAMRRFNQTASASVWGAVAVALGLVIGKLVDMFQAAKTAREEAARLKKEHEEFVAGLRNVDAAAAEHARQEETRAKRLYAIATDEKAARKERLAAVRELQKAYPEYLGKLSAEAVMTGQAADQYDRLALSIRESAKARAAQDKITANEGAIIDLEMERDSLVERQNALKARAKKESDRIDMLKLLRKDKSKPVPANLSDLISLQTKNYQTAVKAYQELDPAIDALNEKIGEHEAANEELARRYNLAASRLAETTVTPDAPDGSAFTPYVSSKEEAKGKRKAELEAKRELAKANAAYKAAMEKAKGDWEAASAENEVAYSAGARAYSDYLAEKERLDLEYLNNRIAVYEQLYEGESEEEKALLLKYDEDYRELLLKRAETERKQAEAASKRKVADLKKEYGARKAFAEAEFSDPSNPSADDEAAKAERLFRLKIEYLAKYKAAYKVGSKEWTEYEAMIQEEEQKHMLDNRARMSKFIAKWADSPEPVLLDARHDTELAMLEELYAQRRVSEEEYMRWKRRINDSYDAQREAAESSERDFVNIPGPDGKDVPVDTRTSAEIKVAKISDAAKERNAILKGLDDLYERGLISEEVYAERCAQIRKKAGKEMADALKEGLDPQLAMLVDLGEAWRSLFSNIAQNGRLSFEDLKNVAANTVGAMCAGMEVYGQFAQAQAQIEIAATEKKYDAMIEAAEGNTYKVNKLEKEKEERVAKIKADASKKEFAVKVFEAIANTASNAISAYGSLAGIPVVGPALGAAAAAAATALGMVQVALIKKQQQAAEAQGYAEGGFTKPGGKYEPAGVVHAGEWVASRKLVGNPRIRPLLEALDYAQRTNTVGAIEAADVSRTITAPLALAYSAPSSVAPAGRPVQTEPAPARSDYDETMRRLADRLDEPFVTVNTVSGEGGINEAQERYRRLMKNKSPKSRNKSPKSLKK